MDSISRAAAELGRRGGAVASAAQKAAARENGRSGGRPAGPPSGAIVADGTYRLSTRQLNMAITGGISLLLPWPAHIIGEFGSGTFDGSPVSPEACDRVMDAYVAEALIDFDGGRMALPGNPPLYVHSVIAGRAKTADGLVPCITVRIGTAQQVDGFRREVWAHRA
jgi:hypothetical protein